MFNKIMVIGNLGNDPEMRYTANGNPVTSFNIATNRSYTGSDGERVTETEWFRVSAWRQLAELCNQFLAKGRLAYVEGRLRSNKWESPADGQTRCSHEITADKVLFLDRTPSAESASNMTSPEEGAENLPW